jgi:transcriptional regulator
MSKFSKVNLASVVPIIEEESSLEDISVIYDEQNLVDVIKEDLSERPQEAFKKKTAENSPQQIKRS